MAVSWRLCYREMTVAADGPKRPRRTRIGYGERDGRSGVGLTMQATGSSWEGVSWSHIDCCVFLP